MPFPVVAVAGLAVQVTNLIIGAIGKKKEQKAEDWNALYATPGIAQAHNDAYSYVAQVMMARYNTREGYAMAYKLRGDLVNEMNEFTNERPFWEMPTDVLIGIVSSIPVSAGDNPNVRRNSAEYQEMILRPEVAPEVVADLSPWLNKVSDGGGKGLKIGLLGLGLVGLIGGVAYGRYRNKK